MPHMFAIGINHKTASIGTREKFFLHPSEKELLLMRLKNDPKVVEAFVLSTCNRTEVYASLISSDDQILFEHLFKVKKITDGPAFLGYFYTHSQQEALDHLLRVVTGLDSLILGEKQILGQIKEAFELSRSLGCLSKSFNILSHIVVETGKKVRRETQIDFGGASVSWAAVSKAQQVLGSLEDKTVLILGSGKMGQLAIQQLKNRGVSKVMVMNRTICKAVELADQCQGQALGFWEIKEALPKVDVCICSTGAPHYLLEKDLIAQVMAQRPERKLVCVDISMPRNISPEVADVENTFLFTVDDLDKMVEDNFNKRQACVEQVEMIIQNKADEYYRILDKSRMAYLSA